MLLVIWLLSEMCLSKGLLSFDGNGVGLFRGALYIMVLTNRFSRSILTILPSCVEYGAMAHEILLDPCDKMLVEFSFFKERIRSV